ncbi:MAG: MFS transporter [bacterium]
MLTIPQWKRTLYLLWMVQFLSGLAMTLGLIFVPFFLVEDPTLGVKSASDRLLFTSLIFAGPFFTTILATPFWGFMADRTGRRQQVVRATLGLGVCQVLMGFAQTPEQLVAIRMLQGAVSGVVAANMALLSASAPAEQQGRALAQLQTANPAGQILGPIIGGFLAATLGYREVYWLLGAFVMATGLLAWVLVCDSGAVRVTAPFRPFRGLLEAAQRAYRSSPLRSAFAILFTGQLAFATAQVVFAIYAGKVIDAWVTAGNIAPAWWNRGVGFTALAATLAGLANFLMLPRWGQAHDRGVTHLTTFSAGSISVVMLLLAFWPPWWLVLAGRAGIGASLGGTATLQYATITQHVPVQDRGQFMGLATSAQHLGSLLGFLVGGGLAQIWGESGNFVLSAMLYITVAAVALKAVGHRSHGTARAHS